MVIATASASIGLGASLIVAGVSTATAPPPQPSIPVTGFYQAPVSSVSGTSGDVGANEVKAHIPTVSDAPLPSPAQVNQDTGEELVNYTSLDLSGIGQADGANHHEINWDVMGPLWLRAEKANLSIPVVPIGERPRNDGSNIADMEVPASYQAGWFNKSAPIDSAHGTTTIMGHINYPTTDGTFKPAPMAAIYNLHQNDVVELTSENGKLTRWHVTKTDTVDQNRLEDSYDIDDKNGPRRLILFTCDLGKDGFTFTENHVVLLEPLP